MRLITRKCGNACQPNLPSVCGDFIMHGHWPCPNCTLLSCLLLAWGEHLQMMNSIACLLPVHVHILSFLLAMKDMESLCSMHGHSLQMAFCVHVIWRWLWLVILSISAVTHPPDWLQGCLCMRWFPLLERKYNFGWLLGEVSQLNTP